MKGHTKRSFFTLRNSVKSQDFPVKQKVSGLSSYVNAKTSLYTYAAIMEWEVSTELYFSSPYMQTLCRSSCLLCLFWVHLC